MISYLPSNNGFVVWKHSCCVIDDGSKVSSNIDEVIRTVLFF